jgi:hypothetical protein
LGFGVLAPLLKVFFFLKDASLSETPLGQLAKSQTATPSDHPKGKGNESSRAGLDGAGGGYLDRVDDESGEEEEQAEGQPDEHERGRHGRQPLPLPSSFSSSGRRRRRRAREADGVKENTGVALGPGMGEGDGWSVRARLFLCATSDHPLPFFLLFWNNVLSFPFFFLRKRKREMLHNMSSRLGSSLVIACSG